ncbi:hypothetical protein [Nocardia sp. NPDC059228]|uniref:hypothetical protein n=1 Tax=Nocardia sp. NPDC059228 TaxID=3346777 RepID=UPI0036C41633
MTLTIQKPAQAIDPQNDDGRPDIGTWTHHNERPTLSRINYETIEIGERPWARQRRIAADWLQARNFRIGTWDIAAIPTRTGDCPDPMHEDEPPF